MDFMIGREGTFIYVTPQGVKVRYSLSRTNNNNEKSKVPLKWTLPIIIIPHAAPYEETTS